MLIDANLLLIAEDSSAPDHENAERFLVNALNGRARVGLPWSSLEAFLRIRTNARAYARPLTPNDAWSRIVEWINAPASWIPSPTEQHAEVLGDLITRYQLRANLIPDAALAALAIEHGVAVCSTDSDFARFDEITWINPLRATN
ncbi:MAG TPA: TA system VapC family ribonuclease toxin [Actinomycetota bacterium]|nr:TA system VapC family ribonuclease toxin [Actinomycetota bacterium]